MKYLYKNRLIFGLAVICLIASLFIFSCGGTKFKHVGKRVIVLGIDGMDPNLTHQYLAEGVLPNFARLADAGSFRKLTTSQPPQSPVAWSNFITGMDPGGHGIFDFIHRDASTRVPYLSTSGMEPPAKILKIGKYRIPLKGGKAKNLRKGTAFWQILEAHGIPGVVFKIPANFPPVESNYKTFSGMGTPDMLGTYGIFTFFTDDSSLYNDDVSGGKITMVKNIDGTINTEIIGPANSMLEGDPSATVPVEIYIDPIEDNIRIVAGEKDIIMLPGEWSDWVELKFELLKPIASATGIVRFYLESVRPHLRLYCSPVNIAPGKPALPLSTPPEYSEELYNELGDFYTLGIAEDTKAFSAGYFDIDDYLSQSKIVLKERLREFDYTWKNFDDGFYFFYFSSLDQNSHTLWSTFDKESPLYDPEINEKYGSELMNFYIEMDKVLGRVLDEMNSDDLLLVMSDHGFAGFYYCFDLNTWLLENGYITLKDSTKRNEEFFPGVVWRKTKAYGLGINSLYLNVKGREGSGSVNPGDEYENLRNELIGKLTSIIDPNTGKQVITSVWKREEIYHGPEVETAPDLIIGYNAGYRASWDTILGKFPPHVISINHDKWCGDHCIDNQWVPGVLYSNRKITMENPALYDLAPTILEAFGIEIPDNMVGSSVFTDSE